MASALLIRLRPRGPWRYGPADGARDSGVHSLDALYRSDRLYSALTLAMQKLGPLEDWLDATARAGTPAVTFSSLFPFQGDTLFAIPPATLWPPPQQQVTAPNAVFLARIRWQSVSFVPLSVIDTLLTGGSILADQWFPDSESRCLLRRDRPSTPPMRVAIRHTAPVDRLTQQAHVSSTTAAIEFEPGAGLWTVVRFANDAAEANWRERIQGAFRLLADSGFGARRSAGWGQAHEPEFRSGEWPSILLPKLSRSKKDAPTTARYWLLSLYVPAANDSINWREGAYELLARSGRIETGAQSGIEKKSLRMIAEGSVLAASAEPVGAAVDVAPENFAHPVYRSGLALALELPEVIPATPAPVEEPTSEEAVIEPCPPIGTESVETEPGSVSDLNPDAEPPQAPETPPPTPESLRSESTEESPDAL